MKLIAGALDKARSGRSHILEHMEQVPPCTCFQPVHLHCKCCGSATLFIARQNFFVVPGNLVFIGSHFVKCPLWILVQDPRRVRSNFHLVIWMHDASSLVRMERIFAVSRPRPGRESQSVSRNLQLPLACLFRVAVCSVLAACCVDCQNDSCLRRPKQQSHCVFTEPRATAICSRAHKQRDGPL